MDKLIEDFHTRVGDSRGEGAGDALVVKIRATRVLRVDVTILQRWLLPAWLAALKCAFRGVSRLEFNNWQVHCFGLNLS